MVIDVCSFNGEHDLWDIHYNVLKDHVDQFIVVESTKTFSGKDKELNFDIKKYPQVSYYVVSNFSDEKLWELAKKSPNTKGAEHWKMEFYQKESIKKALTHLNDNDIVFVGDVDEIWNPDKSYVLSTSKLYLKVYTYYLNLRSSEVFRGTLLTTYGKIKNACLNHLRSNTELSQLGGWHFTSMGGAENLKKKLTDSYTQDSYATPYVLDNLAYNIENAKDFLGRDFTYEIDESQWPEYLRQNRMKYKHLLK